MSDYMDFSIVTCPACNGTGGEWKRGRDDKTMKGMSYREPCEKCGGKGKWPRDYKSRREISDFIDAQIGKSNTEQEG